MRLPFLKGSVLTVFAFRAAIRPQGIAEPFCKHLLCICCSGVYYACKEFREAMWACHCASNASGSRWRWSPVVADAVAVCGGGRSRGRDHNRGRNRHCTSRLVSSSGHANC